MNRRHFLSLLTAGVAGIALDQAIPLGRVWSFPKKIVIPQGNRFLTTDEFRREFETAFALNFNSFDHSYYAIRENGWQFPTAACLRDNSHTPS